VQIGATLAATLANLMTFLNGSTDANLIKVNLQRQRHRGDAHVANYPVQVVGTAGNALTLAKSSTAIASLADALPAASAPATPSG
jgi:hypothetical protein